MIVIPVRCWSIPLDNIITIITGDRNATELVPSCKRECIPQTVESKRVESCRGSVELMENYSTANRNSIPRHRNRRCGSGCLLAGRRPSLGPAATQGGGGQEEEEEEVVVPALL